MDTKKTQNENKAESQINNDNLDKKYCDSGYNSNNGNSISSKNSDPSDSRHHFFAFLARMKYINRWGLMRNTRNENIQEHSLQVAVIAHALAIIKNQYFYGNVNADRAAVIGLFHDCDEIITGDMPTPIKYFNESIRDAYREVEIVAKNRLLSMLPEELNPFYRQLIFGEEDKAIWKIVKAADTISAYIKCVEELSMGNSEFEEAAFATKQKILAIDLPEVELFMKEYIDAFHLSLDELGV